ncbi:iron chelate uptake ABC transporter family permease subunit [Actinomyces bowdenii]|uniref:Iron chelate uptake ABC transporter family permease subunit n=1 Tax=Actinomyces bowdenii TaxID=131109 RepID=A0A853ENG5_9ACTO|nr:iron chelate uptake ABC transporter family permease subunit [Actinomyces bowdenii]MBF0697669.1 iron chelate uptake ABC transporter family permease subunit [Actinomyces bowdenii]NYS69842.1 iron chelate uptake ABC transporter family permease subunit [Actinomyces bowdenii]
MSARLHPGWRLVAMALLALALAAFFMSYDVRSLHSALRFRLPTLGALVIVGWAVAVSTVAFQTITANRILTPAIMGLDAIYALVQTLVVALAGGQVLATTSSLTQFAATTAVMVGASWLLIVPLLSSGRQIHVLVLAGIILGTLLRSIVVFIQRLLDPNEFFVLQSRLFASFSGVGTELLWTGAGVVGVLTAWLWWRRRTLDVLLLGRPTAVSLGVAYDREVRRTMVVIALLVCVSTALVGPITFFGLLVAHLAYRLAGSYRHAYTLPMAALCAMVTLVGGQAILQHLLDWGTVLSVVVELAGGLLLIILLIREGKRQ